MKDTLFLGGGSILLLEGSQAMPALPSDKGNEDVRVVSSEKFMRARRNFDFLINER